VVTGVRFRTPGLFEWNSAAAGSGTGARHDVMQGLLSQLPPASRSGETCLANDSASRTMTDDRNPPTGTGFYYMIRASNACGTGTYGAGSTGIPRNTEACQ
jgi:hypothetical protein